MLRTLLCCLLALLPACGGSPGKSGPPDRIVLIVVDTLRRDHVGAYGSGSSGTPTPNIDRLAAEGTLFRNAVSSFHSTPTSMASLFTGHTPSLESGRNGAALPWNPHSWCGLARFARPEGDACIPAAVPTLAETLRDLGYWTVGIHSHPLLRRPSGFERGFQRWSELKGASPHLAFGRRTKPTFAAARAGTHVNAAVFDALDARQTDHFFLYAHYLDAHDWELARVSYADAVRAADRVVGELLDGLAERGLLDGSVVILTSDHGESLSEQHFMTPRPQHAGNPSFQTVLRVPLILGGARLEGSERLMRGDDVFRLIVELAGGHATEADIEAGEHLVTERTYRVYRKGRWKSFWPRGGGPVRLVDLETDPGELRDVASAEPAVTDAHRERIQALAAALARDREIPADVDPERREQLRELGYLEPAYDLDTAADEP